MEAFFRKDLAGQLGNLAARLSPRVISRLPAGAQHFVAPLSFTAEDHIILEKLAALPRSSLVPSNEGVLTQF